MTSPEWSLARALVAFVAALRERGVAVSPAESADALAALEHVPINHEPAFAGALRACLAKTPVERERFDAAFDVFWRDYAAEPARAIDAANAAKRSDVPGVLAREGGHLPDRTGARNDESDSPGHGASAQRMQADFATVGDDEREAMLYLIRTLGRRLAVRAARRWRTRHRGTLDIRASLRRAIARGGEVFELRKRRRRLERPRLVVFADVSYSMDAYSRFFLCFAHAFAQAFRSVESFVFSTRLSRVTPVLARGRLEAALAALPESVTDWAGGTRIATSLETYELRHADTQLDRNTVVMIVSDGWDTDETAHLEAVLRRLRGRCRALVWLDPLMDHPRYFSSMHGVQHDSPHIDICAPARNLDGLARFADRLAREKLV